jgi:hypothetical protein
MRSLESNGSPAKKSWCEPQIVLISQNRVGGGPAPTYHEGSLVTKSVKGTAVYFTNGKTGINNHTKHHYHS